VKNGICAGWKASIVLEELGVPYDVKKINLSDNEQKQDWFLKINPNGRYIVNVIGKWVGRISGLCSEDLYLLQDSCTGGSFCW